MSTYCPASEVQDLLPPNSVGTGSGRITTAQLATCVTAGSDYVNAQLAHLYWPFTDYSASPATTPPYVVRRAAAYFGAAEALYLLRQVNEGLEESDTAAARKIALEMLKEYADGTRQIAPVTTTQVLNSVDWGDGDPLTTNQAYLTATECEIIVDSATISNYIYGEDFIVYYLTNHRRWVIERYDSAIGSAVLPATGTTISFEYSFLKKRETVTAGIRQGRLLRG